jgi:hypothetical protein
MFTGEIGVGGDRSRRREVEIALEWKAQRAAGGGELVQAHVTEFRFPEAEVAETEGEILALRVQLREELGGIAVGGEELDDGFEVDGSPLLVEGGALGPAVFEEFLVLDGSDELHGSIPVWADPSGPFTEQTDRAGSARNRTQIIKARAAPSKGDARVTAALRWRGRCFLQDF